MEAFARVLVRDALSKRKFRLVTAFRKLVTVTIWGRSEIGLSRSFLAVSGANESIRRPWYFGTAVAHCQAGVVMTDLTPTQSRLCWCQVPVPQELDAECLCVLHFILSIDRDCADLRRETALGRTSAERQSEIASYVKATAMKLTEVATGRTRLSDEFKKRILTTYLTLMNLKESLDRSANRSTGMRELRAPVAPVAVPG